MRARRFFLRLAVACITFVIGVTAALLSGATTRGWFDARRAPRVVILRDDAFAPRFQRSPLPPCNSFGDRRDFWRRMYEPVPGNLDGEPPLSPPPMTRHRAR
ncbi:MAG: hypothetical protein LC746_02095 [Acidobacteria bacterium]|nr:hypothetical protein [Acidobacteriota bacterium]